MQEHFATLLDTSIALFTGCYQSRADSQEPANSMRLARRIILFALLNSTWTRRRRYCFGRNVENRHKNRWIIAAIVLVLLLAVGLVFLNYQNKSTPTPQTTVTQTPVAPSSETPTHIPPPAGCPDVPAEVTRPTKFEVFGKGQTFKVISVGLVDGAAEAPPPNEGYTIAWWEDGPKIGSQEGKVVLSSHTFQYGGALGNDLNNGAWDVGQVIKISDDAGNSACYSYSERLHVKVADYDPDSNILYDFEDPRPRFALVVCSDYTLRGEALGRMIYYADLIR